MGLYKEGIQQAREASEIFERLGDTANQAQSLILLAYALHSDNQLDAAEDLLVEKDEQFRVCQGRRILGHIYRSKGDTEKAIHHCEVALGIASSLNYHAELFEVHFALSGLFSKEGRFNEVHAHIERAKSHAANGIHLLARASWLQAAFFADQYRFEEAKSEALYALGVFEKLGAETHAVEARKFLGEIDRMAQGNGLGSG